MVSLNNFAMSFVSIFVPIYLLEIGYPFSIVITWLMVHHLSILMSTFLAVEVSNKIGLVRSLHIRFILLISYLLLLIFVLKDSSSYYLYYIIAIISGASVAFYWLPLNILFLRNTNEEKMGRSVSKLMVIPKIFSTIGPFIAALIAVKFGFNTMFAIAVVLVFFVFIPIISLKSEKTNFKFSKKAIKGIWTKNKKFFLPEIIDNLTEDAMVIWTIFIYITLASTIEVGIVGTIAAIASMLFILTIGKLTDKWNKHKLLKIGAVLVSLVWLLNFIVGEFMPNQIMFYVATVFASISMKTFIIPYSSLMLNRAKEYDAQFMVLREIPTVLGRLILFGITIPLHEHIPYVFLAVGVIFTYFWFLNTKKLE